MKNKEYWEFRHFRKSDTGDWEIDKYKSLPEIINRFNDFDLNGRRESLTNDDDFIFVSGRTFKMKDFLLLRDVLYDFYPGKFKEVYFYYQQKFNKKIERKIYVPVKIWNDFYDYNENEFNVLDFKYRYKELLLKFAWLKKIIKQLNLIPLKKPILQDPNEAFKKEYWEIKPDDEDYNT